MLRPTDLLIDDSTPTDVTHAASVGGVRMSRGMVPRDMATHPHCYSPYAVPFESLDLPLIPRSEWADRIKEGEETQSFLSHIRRRSGPNNGPIPSLDQDGWGYCWNHSATMCAIMTRAVMNQPYVRLSAFMIGCLVKNYRDEGGWGAQALDFMVANGVPSVEFWPEKSSSRSNDTPAMRANAALHKVAESWVDLGAAVYDRNLTEDQVMTCLLCRIPVIGDFNWWGHSVCLLDPVLVEAGSYGKRGINSWTDGWGDMGEFVLRGGRAALNGGAALRSTRPSLD